MSRTKDHHFRDYSSVPKCQDTCYVMVGPFEIRLLGDRVKITDTAHGEAMYCAKSAFVQAICEEVENLTANDANAVYDYFIREF